MCNLEHGAVEGWELGMVGEEEVATSTAECVGYTEIASVTVSR